MTTGSAKTSTEADVRATAARALRDLASQARRLPPPNHRNPHAFHEARSELAAEIAAIAAQLEGK
jgi:hypothetical protein